MNKFKVGDKVVCIKGRKSPYPDCPDLILGEEYTVLSGPNSYNNYKVQDYWNGWWNESRFELVKESKMFNVDEFRTGQRVVYRNGEVGIVLKDIEVIGLKDGFNLIPKQNQFEYSAFNENYTIDKIYKGFTSNAHVLDFNELGELIWKREVETEAQKKVKELEQTIFNAQKQLAELKKEI